MYKSISQLFSLLNRRGQHKADRFDVIVVYSLFLTFIVVNLTSLISAFYFSQLTSSIYRTIAHIPY